MTASKAGDDGRAWIEELGGTLGTVAGMIPSRFSRAVRIFHPPWQGIVDRHGMPGGKFVTWREVAEAQGRVLEPAMRWDQIAPPPPLSDFLTPPSPGGLERDQLAAVFGVLLNGPVDCEVGAWTGGLSSVLAELTQQSETFTHRGLTYAALRLQSVGAEDLAAILSDASFLLWPYDCTWYLECHPDFTSTYAGLDEALERSLVEAVGVEALKIPLDAPLV